jgi:hypothetical protein
MPRPCCARSPDPLPPVVRGLLTPHLPPPAERTLFRAKAELRVKARRLRLGGKRVCYWLLPEQELPDEVWLASWQEGAQEFHRRVAEQGKEPAKKGA